MKLKRFITSHLRTILLGFLIVLAVMLISIALVDSFIAEVIVSLLPYYAILALFGAIFAGFDLYFLRYRRGDKLAKFTILAILLSVVSFAFFGARVGQYYYSPGSIITSENTNGGFELRVAFFNKLYLNRSYNEINAYLVQLQPDIIGFAEYQDIDTAPLTSLKSYEYQVKSSFSRSNGVNSGVVVFSRFPLRDLTSGNYPLPHVNVIAELPNGAHFELIALHTAAPTQQFAFDYRRLQLEFLQRYISSMSEARTRNLVVMGDFNLTPWSPSYGRLAGSLAAKDLANSAIGTGFQTTWSSNSLKLLRAHIDHMFIGSSIIKTNFEVGPSLGSDHQLIYADLKI